MTALALLTLLLLTFLRWDFVFAHMSTFEGIDVVVRKLCTIVPRIIARCLHMAMLTCMIESEMSCEIEGVQLRSYVSEFTAEDIRVVIGTKYLSITTCFHKAMQDLDGANPSWTARLSLFPG